ncbi:MAG: peptidylprolyl isomerase [Bacteroidales bacterium]|nr:peptidylprolyl isomerase [Bacteroidales bacterium]
MRRILSGVIVAVLMVIPVTLSAQRYENGLADKTIALIGNEAIFLSQLEAEIQVMAAQGQGTDRNTRCQMLENIMEHKLFLNQARLDSLEVGEDNVEMDLQQRLSTVLTQLGGEKEVEEYFKKPIHKLKEEWRDMLREQSLIQQMQQEVMRGAGQATPSEVEKFYKQADESDLPIISTQYRISQIVLYPDQNSAKLAAKERLLSFRERILKGEKFSTLATLYSEDPGSAIKGGELGMASKNIFWPQFSDAAMALKNGQISQIVETPDGLHLIQMIEKDGEMFNARHILLKPKYTSDDRIKAFNKLDSLKTKIEADSISFELAARINSEDPKSAVSGGLMADENTGSTLFEKDLLKPADYSVIKDMKEGEISEPFESTDNEGRSGNTIYKILRLEKIIPSHTATFKDDFEVILNIANSDRQQKAIDNFIKEKQAITYIKLDDLFKQCNFEREGWIK